MPRIAVFTALFFLALSPACAQDSNAVLEAFKQATGGAAWDGVKSLRVSYAASGSGLSGEAVLLSDVATGRYRLSYALGPAKGADGYDGQVVWTADASGQMRLRETEEAKALAVNEAYRNALAYWYPERRQAEISSSLLPDRSMTRKSSPWFANRQV